MSKRAERASRRAPASSASEDPEESVLRGSEGVRLELVERLDGLERRCRVFEVVSKPRERQRRVDEGSRAITKLSQQTNPNRRGIWNSKRRIDAVIF